MVQKKRLTHFGLTENYVIDKTPEHIWRNLSRADYLSENYELIYENTRGCEIDEWLDNHKEIQSYLIIDDRTDFTDEQKKYLIKTNPKYGLTEENYNEALKTLNK